MAVLLINIFLLLAFCDGFAQCDSIRSIADSMRGVNVANKIEMFRIQEAKNSSDRAVEEFRELFAYQDSARKQERRFLEIESETKDERSKTVESILLGTIFLLVIPIIIHILK